LEPATAEIDSIAVGDTQYDLHSRERERMRMSMFDR